MNIRGFRPGLSPCSLSAARVFLAPSMPCPKFHRSDGSLGAEEVAENAASLAMGALESREEMPGLGEGPPNGALKPPQGSWPRHSSGPLVLLWAPTAPRSPASPFMGFPFPRGAWTGAGAAVVLLRSLGCRNCVSPWCWCGCNGLQQNQAALCCAIAPTLGGDSVDGDPGGLRGIPAPHVLARSVGSSPLSKLPRPL